MFGKTKNINNSFIMAMGKKAGNLKSKQTAPKTAPVMPSKLKTSTAKAVAHTPSLRKGLGSLGKITTS